MSASSLHRESTEYRLSDTCIYTGMVLTVMRMRTYLYYTPRFFPCEHTLNVDLCPTRVQRSYDIVEVAGSRSHAFSHG